MTLPLFESYREIPLSKGKVALVDAEDYEMLSKWKWHVYWSVDASAHYAEAWDYTTGRTRIMMHRTIMGCSRRDGKQVDHINGNSLDNRRCNLRFVTHSQNQMNRKLHSRSTSGHRGVSWCKTTGKWKVRVNVDGKEVWLGRFADKDLAITAAKRALLHHFGEYARTS